MIPACSQTNESLQIINISGSTDLSLPEAFDATTLITQTAGREANVAYGIVADETVGQPMTLTVVATATAAPSQNRQLGEAARAAARGNSETGVC